MPGGVIDENFYFQRYPLVRQALKKRQVRTCRDHYWKIGIKLGYYPTQVFECECQLLPSTTSANLFVESYYLQRYPFVRDWCILGQTAKGFYGRYGRKMGHLCCEKDPYRQVHAKYHKGSIHENFDPVYYHERYHVDFPYHHYLNNRRKQILQPTAWFNEELYRQLYPMESAAAGCGFSHYCTEATRNGQGNSLEQSFPGVTRKVACVNVKSLQGAINQPKHELVATHPPTIWMMLDTLNPDLFFGGYVSFLEFIKCTIAAGYRTALYLRNGQSEAFRNYQQRFPTCPIGNLSCYCRSTGATFQFGPADRFVARSAWEALDADCFATQTNYPYIFFIQEHESRFHGADSMSFLIEAVYARPHIAIFNSANLCQYFEANKLGCFATTPVRPHFTFEHVTANIQPAPRTSQRKKRLLFYARPEKHAERNLFEIGILALRGAIAQGAFQGWEFCGIGALTGPEAFPLTDTITMILYSKLASAQYNKLLQESDVGLSLMFCPHPGLVHFEMAKAGVITVVNTMPHRPAEFFTQYSPRLVPAESSLPGLIAGLRRAEELSSDVQLRMAPTTIGGVSSWAEVFTPQWLREVYGR